MTPHLSFITLGVDDLERAVAFYRDGLGLATPGIVGREFEHGAVAFFKLQGGLRLALWPRASLAAETGLAIGAPPRGAAEGFALAHNVESRAAVEGLLAQAVAAGARLVKPAAATFYGGYAGWFQDPDAHLWEIAWNPHLAALG
jgi:catechol 2,3-dioxygenase-like lactoylglutathione lyase family enzyme